MSKMEEENPLVEGSPAGSHTEPAPSEKKRKRSSLLAEDELEININLPEPPSKKAKRKEKKAAKRPHSEPETPSKPVKVDQTGGEAASITTTPTSQSRSDFGVWIGNLPWTATKGTLQQFLFDQGGIDLEDIVRLHLPAPTEKGEGRIKPQNKGFAYVDFTSRAVLDKAIALSEKLLSGRRLLIKNAKSFEGRPEKPAPTVKESTKRVFVGNLSFDVTREDLTQHFGRAGEVEDIHMATFEDSGKCKGYAWVRFEAIKAAEAAVRGFFYEDGDPNGDESKEGLAASEGKPKRRKHFINRLHGRMLRCEFAEDAQTRYKKRFKKDTQIPADRRDTSGANESSDTLDFPIQKSAAARPHSEGPEVDRPPKPDKDQRREQRRQRHDARTIAPGQALANAKRSTGAIVAAAGKKVTFD